MPLVIPTTSGKPFCEVCSDNTYTANLQLFSLRQAFRYWKELGDKKAGLSSPGIKEYLVFITVCAGTSISQVLGLNATHSGPGTRVSTPVPLFDQVFGASHRKRSDFKTFIDVYDDCRHFGSPKYPTIQGLTEARCQQFLDLVVDLWDEIVGKYIKDGKDPDNEIEHFSSVRHLL